ncbi:MAG TPA: hypothetical protein VEY32_03980 [Flavisolibacter sp.]|nr:hypothetical protein [Flavisolibacter sp.]
MARIFSIHFSHEGYPHTAMVSVRNTTFFTEYTIGMLPDEIAEELPGNKIISTGQNQLIFANATLDHSTELMQNILKAVADHLQTTTV